MKRLAVGLVLGIAIGATATAMAGTTRYFFLNRGDSAAATDGETACTASPHGGSRLGFICRVGVIVNEKEAAITQYTGFSGFVVIVRKRQSPLP